MISISRLISYVNTKKGHFLCYFSSEKAFGVVATKYRAINPNEKRHPKMSFYGFRMHNKCKSFSDIPTSLE